MADQQRPTVRRRRLGRIMRTIRESRGLTIPDAARLLNRDVSAISRLETGHRGVRRPALQHMLDHYGITDPVLRQQLFDLARSSYRKGWWQKHGGTISPEMMDFISLEAEAISIEFFELVLIPGLLQTEPYARAVISIGPFAHVPERVNELVEIRMKRAEILAKSSPPKVLAIMDEAALRRQVGDAGIMRDQLRHLIDLSQLDHVRLQVLPFSAGAYQGMTGAFKILHVGDHGDLLVVSVDSFTQVTYREDHHEIDAYAKVFAHLTNAALSVGDSRKLIEELQSEV